MKAFSRAIGLALAIVPATAFASSQPRQTETGLPERWASPDVTVVLDPSLDDLGTGTRDAVRTAMETWAAGVPGLPRVTFDMPVEPVGLGRDYKNVIAAAPITLEGHTNDLALTTTYAADDTGDILEADVVFNTRYKFLPMPSPTVLCSSVFDVGAVATHESGHFFGLGEDYQDHATTMYVITAACDAHKRELTPGDTAALAALYATPTAMTAQCNASTPSRGTSGAGVIALGFAAIGFARRMRRDDARRSGGARARR